MILHGKFISCCSDMCRVPLNTPYHLNNGNVGLDRVLCDWTMKLWRFFHDSHSMHSSFFLVGESLDINMCLESVNFIILISFITII